MNENPVFKPYLDRELSFRDVVGIRRDYRIKAMEYYIANPVTRKQTKSRANITKNTGVLKTQKARDKKLRELQRAGDIVGIVQLMLENTSLEELNNEIKRSLNNES